MRKNLLKGALFGLGAAGVTNILGRAASTDTGSKLMTLPSTALVGVPSNLAGHAVAAVRGRREDI